MSNIWILLVVYQIKHFVADYPLQGKFMLRKFLPTPEWILPLLAHASVHAVFTYLIALAVRPRLALWLALFDASTHFVVDRIKASPDLGGRFKPLTKQTYSAATPEQLKSNVYFWWALGADQMAHHLTHYVIIYFLVRS